ncbi:hypothetical protein ACJRO7_004220 [Eucalyptus globulus]|uniref:Uncharacterized protein n=1 Tax=Eucalyptus globulus TaxID=34317 RepID=A0ABD3IWA9_EUCGL
MTLILLVALSLLVQGALGNIMCEQLPAEPCSFSIASNGRWCVLENYKSPADRKMDYECKTSQVAVDIMHEWIETDDCISAYALLLPCFTAKLCSPTSYYNCPNIVDLYFNLALGEEVLSSSVVSGSIGAAPMGSLSSGYHEIGYPPAQVPMY